MSDFKFKSLIFGNARDLKESSKNWFQNGVINTMQTFGGLKKLG